MANRRGSPVQVRDGRAPQGAVVEGLEPISRGSGEAGQALAQLGDRLSARMGKLADRLAIQEGSRAGAEAGADPTFRPRNDGTLRGEAYDKAAIDTYANVLDGKLSRDMIDIYDKYKDKPAELTKAYDALGDAYRKEHVFPEARATFEQRFSRIRERFQFGALQRAEERTQQESRAAFIKTAGDRATVIDRVARADPTNPATRTAIETEIAGHDKAIDAQVDAGHIPADKAEVTKQDFRRKAVRNWYQAQIDALPSVADVQRERERFDKEYREGKLPLVDEEARETIDREFGERATRLQTAATAGVAGVKSAAAQLVDRAIEGGRIEPAELAILAAQTAPTTAGAELYKLTTDKLRYVEAARTPEAVDQLRRALLAGEGTYTDVERAVRADFLRELHDKLTRQLASDPVTYFDRRGEAMPPLGTTDDLAAEIRARVEKVTALRTTRGMPERYLRPDSEVRQLKEAFAVGGDAAIGAVTAIVKGAGDKAPQVLRELGDQAPAMKRIGELILQGTPAALQTARDAAEAIRLRQVPGALPPPAPPKRANELRKEVFGNAHLEQTAREAEIEAAAKLIYEKRMLAEKIDPKNTAEAEQVWIDALQDAAGRTNVGGQTFGGITAYKPSGWWYGSQKARVPGDVRPDYFPRLVDAVRDKDLEDLGDKRPMVGDRPATADDLRRAMPVLSQGGYRFDLGTAAGHRRWIGTKDGKPWVMPWDEHFKPRLRERLPEAFFGGPPPPEPPPVPIL